MNTMTVEELKEIARHEVELALEENRVDHNEKLDQVYKEALRIFCDFMDGVAEAQVPEAAVYSVFSQLMDQNPLTPIEDKKDEWDLVEGFDPALGNEELPEYSLYQNRRRRSLYKKVMYGKEGPEITFSDVDRAISVDINTNALRNGGMGLAVLDEMFPITFPYEPIGRIKIYDERIKYNKESTEDYDTLAILYFRFSDGRTVKVYRFFKKKDGGEFEEITKQEYLSRREKVCKETNKK